MRKLTLLIILVVAAAVALSQEPAKPGSVQSDAQKTAANSIIGAEQQFWEALKNKDTKFLAANVPDDLVTAVPVYATTAGNAVVFLGEVLADGAETGFRLIAPSGVRKIVLDPKQTILTAPK